MDIPSHNELSTKEKHIMRRLILVPVLIFLALAAIGVGIGYWIYNNYTYYSTDDAQVSGQIVSVSAPASGQLTNLSVRQGDTVTQDQTIGTITPAGTARKAPPRWISPAPSTEPSCRPQRYKARTLSPA